MASTAAIRVVAAQENAGQIPGAILPDENAMTRIFAFQFMDANEAAEILHGSLSAQQRQQVKLEVDSRTNSTIVQCSGRQMVGLTTMLGRLEAQAAQEQAYGTAENAARIAKQQAEAQAAVDAARKKIETTPK